MKRDNTQMKGKQEGNRRQIIDCPFCEGDIGGCCFCEHTGKVPVGEGEFIKTEEQTKGIGVQFLKEHNPKEFLIKALQLQSDNIYDYQELIKKLTNDRDDERSVANGMPKEQNDDKQNL